MVTMTDTEIRVKGIAALSASLGPVEAERFIALILREPFDYTRWQRTLFEDQSVAEISAEAARLRSQQQAELSQGTNEFGNESSDDARAT